MRERSREGLREKRLRRDIRRHLLVALCLATTYPFCLPLLPCLARFVFPFASSSLFPVYLFPSPTEAFSSCCFQSVHGRSSSILRARGRVKNPAARSGPTHFSHAVESRRRGSRRGGIIKHSAANLPASCLLLARFLFLRCRALSSALFCWPNPLSYFPNPHTHKHNVFLRLL